MTARPASTALPRPAPRQVAFGMLLNHAAALQAAELDEPWAEGVRTRIRPGLFDHITTGTNR